MQNELQTIKEKRREHERQMENTFESTGTAMLICDDDKRLTYANKKLPSVTGYPLEVVLKNKQWIDYIADKDLERHKTYHRKS